MSDNAGGDESAGAFKKAVEKGAEAQRDFIKSYSAVQQDAILSLKLKGKH